MTLREWLVNNPALWHGWPSYVYTVLDPAEILRLDHLLAEMPKDNQVQWFPDLKSSTIWFTVSAAISDIRRAHRATYRNTSWV